MASHGPAADGDHFIPTVTVEHTGCHAEIGRKVGEAMAERIAAVVEFYMSMFQARGLPEAAVRQAATQCERAVLAYQGGVFAEEIRALAAAADLPAWKVFAINARTEIINAAPDYERLEAMSDKTSAPGPSSTSGRSRDKNPSPTLPAPPLECTSVALPDLCVAGQNWDWAEEMRRHLVLLRLVKTSSTADGGASQRGGAQTILMVCEPGIIGKVGCNSEGVGVCLNLLSRSGYGGSCMPRDEAGPWPGSRWDGIPVHLLLRAALESESAAAAAKVVSAAPRGWASMSLVIVADAENGAAAVELDGPTTETRWVCPNRPRPPPASPETDEGAAAPTDAILRTNHFVGCGLGGTKTGSRNSLDRYKRGWELLSFSSQAGTAEHQLKKNGDGIGLVKGILGDRKGQWPICRKFKPEPALAMNTGTIVTMVIDLRARLIHLGDPNAAIDRAWKKVSV